MKECACSKERALELLMLNKNDVAKAKRHHEIYVKHMKSSSGQPQVPNSASPSTLAPKTDHHRAATSDPSESPGSSASFFSMPTHTPQSDDATIHSFQNDGPYQPSTTSAQQPEGGKNVQEKPEVLESRKYWDFILPHIPNTTSFGEDEEFTPFALARIMQHEKALEAVRNYLEAFERTSVESHINDEVGRFPLIFYGAATNNEGILQLLINFGANVSAVHDVSQTPLLAFAIINGAIEQIDSTAIVSTLLSHGASPDVIPAEVFTPFDQDPLTDSGFKKGQKSDVNKLTAWCTDASRVRLAKATNLTQRYYLEQATKLKKPSARKRQVAQLKKAEGLLGVQYVFVGQSIATEVLTKTLLTHLLMGSERPLVLCFAGPSGHGKTELARQLGHLLSLDLEVVDCTTVSREMELFGPREPYVGSEKGSPLNNFLTEHSGQRCIVFLDEFEKTTREIHQALLLPFENGEYEDRRDHGKVNCWNTIWILATNALDSTVLDFCEENSKIFDGDKDEKSKLSKKLSKQLRQISSNWFTPAVTGRISHFVPFLPFSPGEQAVITHKMLLQLAEEFRRPIVISEGSDEQLIGDVRLRIRRDATVCRLLAEDHYHKSLGARSLKAGVRQVKGIVAEAYLEEDDEIQENGGLWDFIIDVQGDEIVGRAG
ncbi:hypothetical protein CDV36_005445 [Fusarium kuroshium]|uniref:AAA+ ATPase domain-containing protein n=1 Tax=Fusarium kuroshium TaxID=2010991 RepID=A0A3M2SBM5_9HYPO|nr:hypothetical protein CDV36_005445 [Fusarium kuroshium]